MVHGDDSGLVLPPRIAPVQTMIIPIQQKKEGVLDKAFELRDMLKGEYSVKVDDSDKISGLEVQRTGDSEVSRPVLRSDRRISRRIRR